MIDLYESFSAVNGIKILKFDTLVVPNTIEFAIENVEDLPKWRYWCKRAKESSKAEIRRLGLKKL